MHRFQSPAWFNILKGHLAGAVVGVSNEEKSKHSVDGLMAKIVSLKTGEALVFCPSALMDVSYCEHTSSDDTQYESESEDENISGSLTESETETTESEESYEASDVVGFVELGLRYMRMQVRMRLTADGGRSILAQ